MNSVAMTAPHGEPAGLDVAAIRADFPILHQQINGHDLVYLDNAATTQKPAAVIDAVTRYYRQDNANVHRGVHTLSERATRSYEDARDTVQRFINAASRKEIIFTRGTTESINLLAYSLPGRPLQAGDEVLITHMEHHSNIVPWQLACKRSGATLKVIPMQPNGSLDMAAAAALFTARTRLLGVVHVSNALGTVNPIAELVAMARSVDALVLVDGAQAVAHMSVDVQKLDADFYAFSGHKLFAPTGIGVLYGKQDLLQDMPPFQGGGDMIARVTFASTSYNALPYRFEAGTPNMAGAIGLGAAIDYVHALGLEAIQAHETDLLAYAVEQARAMSGLRLIGTAAQRAGVMSFVLENIHPHDIGTILDQQGVAVRAGHHCAMPVMDYFSLPATARASFAVYNTRAEIDALFVGLGKVQHMLG